MDDASRSTRRGAPARGAPSARTGVAGAYGDALKLKVAAPPVDGTANDEVRCFLADASGVRPSDVSILVGERSRDKIALVRGVTAGLLRDALRGDPRR